MKKQKLIQFSTEELNTIICRIFKGEFESLKEMIDRRKPVYFKNYQIYIKASEIKSLMIKLER